MKLFYFVTFFIAYSCSAQSYKFQYYLDENFSSVNKENATFIGKGYNKNELFQLDCFNKITGEFFMSAHFTDSSLNILNGLFESYYPKQKRENLGYYVNSLEEGIWQRWDSVGNKIDSSNYVTGKKIFSKIFKYSSDNKVYRVEMADSVTNKFHYIDYNTYDEIINDAVFKGENGVVTMYDSLRNITTQNVYSKELIEAQCEGGPIAFSNYLRKNLLTNVHNVLENPKLPSGIYTVIIKFTVNTDGSISEIISETNIGFGLEDEGVKLIKKSPKWNSALLYGIPVKALRRQPITFVKSED